MNEVSWINAEFIFKKANALGSKRRDCLAGYHFGSVKMERDITLGMLERIFIKN